MFAAALAGFALLLARDSHAFTPVKAPQARGDLKPLLQTDEWLPNTKIYSITQTPEGYLWMATSTGLARFDGHQISTFSPNDTPGLESSRVAKVFTARDGSLWVGLEKGGVARWRDAAFEVVVPVNHSATPNRWTRSFAQDESGALWFGRGMSPIPSDSPQTRVPGLAFRWFFGRLERFDTDSGLPASDHTHVVSDVTGQVWVQSATECGIIVNGNYSRVGPAQGSEGLRIAPAQSSGMWVARDGKLYHYTLRIAPAQSGGMWVAHNGKLHQHTPENEPELIADLSALHAPRTSETAPVKNEVSAMLEDREGTLWIGTRSDGLFQLRNGQLTAVPTSHRSITSLFQDAQGTLWIGTLSGLNRIRANRIVLWKNLFALNTEHISSLALDSQQQLWIGVHAARPTRSLHTSHRSFGSIPGISNVSASAIASAPNGGVWIASQQGRLVHWNNGIQQTFDLSPGTALTSLFCDSTGSAWVSTGKSVVHCSPEGAQTELTFQAPSLQPSPFAEDSAGRVWLGDIHGNLFYREPSGQTGSLSLPPSHTPNAIRFITPGEDNTLWVGTSSGALYRVREGVITTLPQETLDSEDLRALLIDSTQTVWIASANRLFRIPLSNLEALLDGQSVPPELRECTRLEGIPPIEFSIRRAANAVETPQGTLWFATHQGVLEVHPERIRLSEKPHPPFVEEIRVDKSPLPKPFREIRLNPDPGPIEFHFTSPETAFPERLQFRYRLAGLQSAWFFSGNHRVASFLRLEPGRYRFQVQVSDNDQRTWIPDPNPIEFLIAPAWYQNSPFQILAAIAALLLITGIVRSVVLSRIKRRIQRLEAETALERERIRIARDMHDELGASLTRIALMGDLAAMETSREPKIAGQFAEISHAARTVSSTLDGIVWTVNPHNDSLERLVGYLGEFASEFTSTVGLDLELSLPKNVPSLPLSADTRHHILLAVKEALNNTAKHASASKIRLAVTTSPALLQIELSDNGQGFELSSIAASSNGLQNMRQRFESLGGAFTLSSTPGEGTSLRFSLPLHDHAHLLAAHES
ncbi:MAG: hypothetical protein RLZZ244_2556 [Verrucomicrobiota bacterium]